MKTVYGLPKWQLLEVAALLEKHGQDSSLKNISAMAEIKYGTLRSHSCGIRKPSADSIIKIANLYETLKRQLIKGDLYGTGHDSGIDAESITTSGATG